MVDTLKHNNLITNDPIIDSSNSEVRTNGSNKASSASDGLLKSDEIEKATIPTTKKTTTIPTSTPNTSIPTTTTTSTINTSTTTTTSTTTITKTIATGNQYEGTISEIELENKYEQELDNIPTTSLTMLQKILSRISTLSPKGSSEQQSTLHSENNLHSENINIIKDKGVDDQLSNKTLTHTHQPIYTVSTLKSENPTTLFQSSLDSELSSELDSETIQSTEEAVPKNKEDFSSTLSSKETSQKKLPSTRNKLSSTRDLKTYTVSTKPLPTVRTITRSSDINDDSELILKSNTTESDRFDSNGLKTTIAAIESVFNKTIEPKIPNEIDSDIINENKRFQNTLKILNEKLRKLKPSDFPSHKTIISNSSSYSKYSESKKDKIKKVLTTTNSFNSESEPRNTPTISTIKVSSI